MGKGMFYLSWWVVCWGKLANDAGGVAGDDGVGGDIFGDDGAGPDDGIVADGEAGEDGGVAADPDVVVDGDWFGNFPAVGAAEGVEVVGGGVDLDGGAHHDVGPDVDGVVIDDDAVDVEVAVLAEVDIVAVGAVEGGIDEGVWAEVAEEAAEVVADIIDGDAVVEGVEFSADLAAAFEEDGVETEVGLAGGHFL